MLPNRIEMNKSILGCHSKNRNAQEQTFTPDVAEKSQVFNSTNHVVSSAVNKFTENFNRNFTENNSKLETKLHNKSYLSSLPSKIVSEGKHVYENIDPQEEAIYQNMIFSKGKGLPEKQSTQQRDVSSHQISQSDLHTSLDRRPISRYNFFRAVGVLASTKTKNRNRTSGKPANVKEVLQI